MSKEILFDNESNSFVVIGGGLTGMFISWRLLQQGHKVTLIESNFFLGGLSTSIKDNGFLLDIGPHELLLPKNMSQAEEIKQLMGEKNIFEISDTRKYLFENKLYDYNPSLYQVIFQFGMNFFVNSSKDFLISRIKNFFLRSKFATSEEYLIGTYGKFLYNIWFIPYLLRKFKTTNVQIDEIQKTFESPTLKSILRFTLSKFQKPKLNTSSTNSEIEYYHWYFKYGMGSFIEKLKEKILELDGTIITEANISSIQRKSSSKIINFKKNNQNIQINTDKIIYCTPLSVTCQWFEKIPESLKNQISTPKSFNSIMVFLYIDESSPFDAWIVNSFSPNYVFFRISQQTRLSKFVSPKNKSLICVEIRVSNNDDLWNKDDDYIFNQTVNDLKKSNIINCEKISGFKILKLKNIYPIDSKSTSDLDVEKSIGTIIESYPNEFLLSAIEADGGRISSSNLSSKYQSKTRETGVFRAIVNAEKLFAKISQKINK